VILFQSGFLLLYSPVRRFNSALLYEKNNKYFSVTTSRNKCHFVLTLDCLGLCSVVIFRVFVAVSAHGADAGRSLHGSVREDAQPGDEVVLDDGKLRAFNTPSIEGKRDYNAGRVHSGKHNVTVWRPSVRLSIPSAYLP